MAGDLVGHQDMFISGRRTFNAIAGCESYLCELKRDVIQNVFQDKNLIEEISIMGRSKLDYYLKREIQIRKLKQRIEQMKKIKYYDDIDF